MVDRVVPGPCFDDRRVLFQPPRRRPARHRRSAAEDVMAVSKDSAALPPPLWGRAGERGSPGKGVNGADAAVLAGGENPCGAPLSLPLPHKGGGNERVVAASHAHSPWKFLNESNLVLLCMGLFSTFLFGAA